MIQRRGRQGFTLIELMLAMAFVGILLVAIAAISMNIMRTYTKGITIREVNQAGRTVTEDMQRTIATAVPFSVVKKSGESTDTVNSQYVEKAGQGGRLCTGTYTYAWNYGSTRQLSGRSDESRQPVYNTYKDGGAGDIRLVKVRDTGGLLCMRVTEQIDRSRAKELLPGGDRNLAVQSLAVSSASTGRDDAAGQALYAITLVLGTNDQTQLNAAHTTCLPRNQGSGNEDFCAINRFDSIARAGNRSGSL